jgi:hypothetical protein
VDQTLYRLVKNGTIRRLARGVFVRDERKKFSHFEIASIKAKAFGRTLINFDFTVPDQLKAPVKTPIEPVFFIDGRSSGFHADGILIALQECSQRKMSLGDGKVGQAMRALWRIGKAAVTKEKISHATDHFRRTDRADLLRSIRYLPAWLSDFFIVPERWPGQVVS